MAVLKGAGIIIRAQRSRIEDWSGKSPSMSSRQDRCDEHDCVQSEALLGYRFGKAFAPAAELSRHVKQTSASEDLPMIDLRLSAPTRASLLIPHQEVELGLAEHAVALGIRRRFKIPFGASAFERRYAPSREARTSGNEPPGRCRQSFLGRKP